MSKHSDVGGDGISSKSGGVRVRVLAPLMLAMLGLIGGFALLLYILEKREITEESRKLFRAVPAAFDEELRQEAGMIAAALDGISLDESLRAALAAGDTDALLARAMPLFERLRDQNRITHFYFLSPERVCLLRVHQPTRRGDTINRFTAIEAERTGKLSWGIELGPLGTFTLRVVQPWYVEGRLIGYVELGEEIEHITEHLRRLFDVELYVVIHKQFLDRWKWEEGMTMLGRESEADWDQCPSSVVVQQTLSDVPEELVARFGKGEHDDSGSSNTEVRVFGSTYRIAFHELRDAWGREVGDMVILRDVTPAYAALSRETTAGALTCLAVGAGLFVFFWRFLGRVDRDLTNRTSQLAVANEALTAEVDQRKAAERSLKESEDFLRTAMAAIPGAMIVIDRDHRIVLANEIACRNNGGTDPVADGLTCHQLSHHSDTPCTGESDPCPLRKVSVTKQPITVTHMHYDSEGNERIVEVTGVPIFDENGRVRFMIEASFDITDRKKAEEELLATVHELERFNRLAVGRENRMIELKREVNELARKAGVAPPYDVAFTQPVGASKHEA